MFLSRHPLDNYRFEMKHYGITSIGDFNEFKEAIKVQPNPGRMFRLLALVTGVNHRIAQKSGNKYGSYTIEDFSGKTDFVLFSEDYLRLSPYLQQGASVCITGHFRPRYNQLEFEFKVHQVCLAETLKKQLTKQVNIQVHPEHINKEMIHFVERNLKNFPGHTTLKFILNEPKKDLKISLVSTDKGLEMNDELIHFFEDKPELEIQVVTG
jgi:DNA polymerase-3 subunit alpha